MSGVPIAVLFCALTVGLAGIAVSALTAGRWIIPAAAALIAAWMGSFAWSALRRIRR